MLRMKAEGSSLTQKKCPTSKLIPNASGIEALIKLLELAAILDQKSGLRFDKNRTPFSFAFFSTAESPST